MAATTFLTSQIPIFPATKLSLSAPSNRRRCLRMAAQFGVTMTAYPLFPPNVKLNKYSSKLMEPKLQGVPQVMLSGFGLSEDDFLKPQMGILSVWYEGNALLEAVKRGVEESGMVGVSDMMLMGMGGVGKGFVMGRVGKGFGTRGLCYSLQSKDLIADSMSVQWCDGYIFVPRCDKNIPVTIIAMWRLNRPSIMVYGGTVKPCHFHGNAYDIVSAFQCYGESVSGNIRDGKRKNVILNSCPGVGACGGMYTANTMASAIEAMGMSLPYSSSISVEDPLKLDECRSAGKYLQELFKMDLKPRDIINEKSLRNAMVVVMALGGSTDVVLHLSAIARSVGLELTSDDFQKVSDEVQFLVDPNPSGKYVLEEVHKLGGTPAVIRYLLELGYLDGDCMTVTGKTVAENAQSYPRFSDRQSQGNMAVMKGGVSQGMLEMWRRACHSVGAFLRDVLFFQVDWSFYAINVPATVVGILAATKMAILTANWPLVLRLLLVELTRSLTVNFVKTILLKWGQAVLEMLTPSI